MENAIVAKTPAAAPTRDIGTVTAEIRELCGQAKRMALMYAVEIGRRLVEAKNVLPHGAWGDWLKNEVEFSERSANNFMKLFAEYGSEQISIFGAVSNSQTFADLPYSKALQLLALPAEEREDFAQENDVENLSVRELQNAIREKNEAIARQKELEQACASAEIARHAAEERSAEADTLRQTVEKLQAELESANRKAKTAKEKLEAAISNPTLPPEKLKRLRADLETELRAAMEKTDRAALDAAKKQAADAEHAKEEALLQAHKAEEELAEARARLKTASPEIAAFKELFDAVQATAAKLKAKISTIRAGDPATADKLAAALHAFGATL